MVLMSCGCRRVSLVVDLHPIYTKAREEGNQICHGGRMSCEFNTVPTFGTFSFFVPTPQIDRGAELLRYLP